MKIPTLKAVALILLTILFLVFAFNALPIEDSRLAIDWKQIWSATHNFEANYGSTELRSPPWILPLLWPITLFPLSVSWALAAGVTLTVLIFSAPRQTQQRMWFVGILLLVSSYPALRQIIDGNLEGLVIGAVLIVLWAAKHRNPWALAIGILMAAAKIQETWLLLTILPFWLMLNWPPTSILKAILIAFVIALPFLLWKGAEWSSAMLNFPWPGTAIDSSLQATAMRLDILAPVYWLFWAAIFFITVGILHGRDMEIGRSEAGLLVTASLLLGPYAASNSVLTPFAIGVIPLLHRRLVVALSLIALYDLPFIGLGRPDLRAILESSYWTLILLITWMVFVVDLAWRRHEKRSS